MKIYSMSHYWRTKETKFTQAVKLQISQVPTESNRKNGKFTFVKAFKKNIFSLFNPLRGKDTHSRNIYIAHVLWVFGIVHSEKDS